MIRRWSIPLVLVFMLIAGMVVVNRPADAQSSGCSAVGGALSSSPGVPYDNSEFREFTGSFSAGETISASALGFDNPGTPYPVTLEVNGNAQNPYTIPNDGTYTVRASTNSLPEQANVSVNCGVGGVSGGGPSWGGFVDGRLNGDPAEYYSLWCSGNTLNVYSAVTGRGVLLAAIPLQSLLAQRAGTYTGYPAEGEPLGVRRIDQDAFTIDGSTGNSAPAPGTKAFSLAQCLVANGGAPATWTPIPPRATNTLLPSATLTPRPTRTATATRTASPTKEPSYTPSATRTPAGPSATPTATLLVRTVLPTATRTRPPTRMPTATPTLVTTPFVLGLASLLTSPNDTDGDGTPDGYDFCKYEPGPAYGCPDADGDGVGNPLDMCPDSAGTPATFGCGDGDGDGVHDGYDLCPSFAGSATAYGCPDNDSDGVPNAMDWCPLQTRDAVTQFQGCNDPDGDGFVNGARVPEWFRDDCPAANGVNYDHGCPPPTQMVVPTVDYSATLFAYAAQQGAFEGLVVQGYATPTPACTAANYGFCLGN